jgi:hypothetical protein
MFADRLLRSQYPVSHTAADPHISTLSPIDPIAGGYLHGPFNPSSQRLAR